MSFHHQARVVTSGLEMYLDAKNIKSYPGDGSIWYDLIGSNDGTLVGPVYPQNNSMFFEGDSDTSTHINCGNTLQPNPFTIEMWFNETGGGSHTANHLITSGLVGANFNWNIGLGQAAYNWIVYGAIGHNDNYLPFSADNTYWQNHWFCAQFIFTGTQKQIYFNGNLVVDAEELEPPPYSGANEILVGAWEYSSFTRRFEGYIDTVKIYNKVLSLPELYQNLNSFKSRYN